MKNRIALPLQFSCQIYKTGHSAVNEISSKCNCVTVVFPELFASLLLLCVSHRLKTFTYTPWGWPRTQDKEEHLLCSLCIHMHTLVALERRVTSDQYDILLTDQFYPVLKHFCPDGSGLFQDDNTPLASPTPTNPKLLSLMKDRHVICLIHLKSCPQMAGD